MLSSIPCGDLALNITHPHGMPTLVPSPALEQHWDWRMIQAQADGPNGSGPKANSLPHLRCTCMCITSKRCPSCWPP